MTTDTRPVRLRWQGDTTDGPLHATVHGEIAGTLIRRKHLPGWTLSPETLQRYPMLYGIGPRSLSTWRAKLASMIRNAPPGAPDKAPAPATPTDTTGRLKHARELIIRAVAVLSPIEIAATVLSPTGNDDADDPRVTTAIELTAELRDEIDRITRALREHQAPDAERIETMRSR